MYELELIEQTMDKYNLTRVQAMMAYAVVGMTLCNKPDTYTWARRWLKSAVDKIRDTKEYNWEYTGEGREE